MKLNEKYSIEKEANGFSLIEKTSVEVTKDGRKTGELKDGQDKRSYGTVYQALKGFLKLSVDEAEEVDEITIKVKKAVTEIEEAAVEIEKRFRIEVLRC